MNALLRYCRWMAGFCLLGLSLTTAAQVKTADIEQLRKDMYRLFNKPDSLQQYIQVTNQLIELSKQSNNEELLYKTWSNQAVVLPAHGKREQALEIVKEMSEYAHKNNSKYGLFVSTYTNAQISSALMMEKQAEELLLECIKYKEQYLPNLNISFVYLGLAKIYYNRLLKDKVLEVMEKALREPNLLPEQRVQALAYKFMAVTLDENDKRNIFPDNDYDRKIGDYFVVKETNMDQSISIKYYECETLETCFNEMIVKEELYIDNCLALEKTYLNKKILAEKYFTPDGFNYLSMDYKKKDFQLNYRDGGCVRFKRGSEFADFFVSEICSNQSSKPFLISDCSDKKPSIKNINSNLAYKIGNVHSNPYTVYPYCFGSKRRNIAALSECKNLDRVVVLTDSAKFDFEYEFNYEKFVVIPDFVLSEDSKFNEKDSKKANRTISIFSRISPEKNLSDSLYALKLILEKHDDVVLKIFGHALKQHEINEKE